MAVGVELRVAGHSLGFFVRDLVAVAADHGVDAEGEEVLVVTAEDAGVDDGAKGVRYLGEVEVERLGGQDTRCPDFVRDVTGLVEDEGEDVLVVADRQDRLEDELAVADDDGAVGAVVGVLPEETRVLLVDADDVGGVDGLAFGVAENRGDVVDTAEAVAAELEVVGCQTSTDVTQVKGTLAVERVARVTVRDGHVGERQAVEQGAVVVVNIVEDHALSLVEADLEVPLLPLQCPAELRKGLNCERGSLRLDNLERLEVGAHGVGFRDVLVCWAVLPCERLDGLVMAGRHDVDTNQLEGGRVNDGRDGKGEGVVAAVLFG